MVGDVLVPEAFCDVATDPSRWPGPTPFHAEKNQWPFVAVVVQETDWLTDADGAGAIFVNIAVTTVALAPFAVVASDVVQPLAVIPLGADDPPTEMIIIIREPAGTLPVLLTVTLVPLVKLPLLLLATILVGVVPTIHVAIDNCRISNVRDIAVIIRFRFTILGIPEKAPTGGPWSIWNALY